MIIKYHPQYRWLFNGESEYLSVEINSYPKYLSPHYVDKDITVNRVVQIICCSTSAANDNLMYFLLSFTLSV